MKKTTPNHNSLKDALNAIKLKTITQEECDEEEYYDDDEDLATGDYYFSEGDRVRRGKGFGDCSDAKEMKTYTVRRHAVGILAIGDEMEKGNIHCIRACECHEHWELVSTALELAKKALEKKKN